MKEFKLSNLRELSTEEPLRLLWQLHMYLSLHQRIKRHKILD